MSKVNRDELAKLEKLLDAEKIEAETARRQRKHETLSPSPAWQEDIATAFPPCLLTLWHQLNPFQQKFFYLRLQHMGVTAKRSEFAAEADRRNLKYIHDSSLNGITNAQREGDRRLFKLLRESEWFAESLAVFQRDPTVLDPEAQQALKLYVQKLGKLGPCLVGSTTDWKRKAADRLRDAVYYSYCGGMIRGQKLGYNRRLEALINFGWDLMPAEAHFKGRR